MQDFQQEQVDCTFGLVQQGLNARPIRMCFLLQAVVFSLFFDAYAGFVTGLYLCCDGKDGVCLHTSYFYSIVQAGIAMYLQGKVECW